MITFESVTKAYPPNHFALDDVSFHIEPGEFVFVLGHSGAGKTTLLRLIIREIRPSSGKIIVANHDLSQLPDKEVPHLRRQIGSAFQDFKLILDKTAFENVRLAIEILGKPKSEIDQLAMNLLEQVGLQDKVNLFPSQLSGGEVQRVTIARALALDPVLLFADEPTGNLDQDTSLQIIKILNDINQAGTTVIMATHDQKLADKFDHRQIFLEHGKLIKDTKPLHAKAAHESANQEKDAKQSAEPETETPHRHRHSKSDDKLEN